MVKEYAHLYQGLVRNNTYIEDVVRLEEERFHETLEQGMKILTELVQTAGSNGVVAGKDAFKLYDTYGFPIELTKEILAENKLTLDE